MDTLNEQVEKAKRDAQEMNRLINAYMPFIRKTATETGAAGMDYDDRLSLAMLTFMNCVRQYKNERGNFISFAAACIRNRLIDENRRQLRYRNRETPLFSDDEDRIYGTAADQASIYAYSRERERESLADEIDAFSQKLADFGIRINELPKICPKQSASRKRCVELGQFVADDGEMCESLMKNHRLAQSRLAKQFGLSEKTIEKHRKYIVTIVILLSGDFPLVKAFLPKYKEV